jgi:hypothetical protein
MPNHELVDLFKDKRSKPSTLGMNIVRLALPLMIILAVSGFGWSEFPNWLESSRARRSEMFSSQWVGKSSDDVIKRFGIPTVATQTTDEFDLKTITIFQYQAQAIEFKIRLDDDKVSEAVLFRR